MKQKTDKLRAYFPMSAKSWGIFIFAMGLASLLCLLLRATTTSDTHVPLIFVLAVLVTALMTEGYFFGIMSSIISVFAVNWAFTYPYMKLDFTIYGYPLTFMTMLAVGFAVSTLTTRLKAQEKLRSEADQEKTRANLLRAVSHDLRTPLTSISGSLGLVLESGEDLGREECRELLSDAKDDAQWLCRMVENLLSITRMSGEDNTIELEEELLEELISETVSKFLRRCPGVSIHVSVPEEPVFALMDAMLIEQVLLNLMDNSVQHGGSTDTIRIIILPEDRWVRVSVADNGQGIKPLLLCALFDGSSRLSKLTDSDNNRCMGIGLSVCSTIIKAHGGSISARNLPEGGAEFSFTLPKGEYDYEHS